MNPDGNSLHKDLGSCKASAVAPGGYTSHRNCSDGWTVTPFVATARFLDRHRWQQRTRRRKLELLVRIRECTSPTSPFLLNKTRRRSLKKTKTRSRKLELPVTHMLVRIQLHFSNFPPSLHSLAANLTLDSFASCILSARVLEATASQSSYSQEPNHIGPDPEKGIAKSNVPLKNKGYTMVTENVTSI